MSFSSQSKLEKIKFNKILHKRKEESKIYIIHNYNMMNNIVLYIYSRLDLFNEIEKIFYGIIQDVSLYIIIIIIV